MKILILACSPATETLLCQYVESQNHIVIEWADRTENLLCLIAQNTPHLVIAEPGDAVLSQVDQLRQLFPSVRFSVLQHPVQGDQWKDELDDLLREPIIFPIPRPYADATRLVFHDRALESLASGPLNRPSETEGWQQICQSQEIRFILMLEAARKNQEAAKHYYACLVEQQPGLDEELAYRFTHGSYKGLSWSRDLALKWIGLLAHYVVDAELPYLPLPCSPAPSVDFVHHEIQIEGMYALGLISSCKIKPAIRQALDTLVTARFEGQSESELLDLSVRLYGLAKCLEQVGKAQVEAMDEWMDPSFPPGSPVSSMTRRNLGILRDFWDLNYIVLGPEPLQSIISGFHSGKTYLKHGKIFPSFKDFKRLLGGDAEGGSLQN